MKIRDVTICYPDGVYIEYTICSCGTQDDKNTVVCNRIEIHNGDILIYEVYKTPGRNRRIHGLPYIVDYEGDEYGN